MRQIILLKILFTFISTLTFFGGVLAGDTGDGFPAEPKMNCPVNSIYTEDTVKFMVTAPPAVLFPVLGDFYGESWPKILTLPDIYTFTPPTRTLTTLSGNLTLTELLLANSSIPDISSFMLRWELSSEPFRPTGRFDIMHYQQSIHVYPVCTGGVLASVAWKLRVCVYGDPATGMAWFKERITAVVGNVWREVAAGWMGGPETSVGNCFGLNKTEEENNATETSEEKPAVTQYYVPVPELNSGAKMTIVQRGLLVGFLFLVAAVGAVL